jgi:hypothetical protein
VQIYKNNVAVSKVINSPQTPKAGKDNYLIIRTSSSSDREEINKKGAFKTAPFIVKK